MQVLQEIPEQRLCPATFSNGWDLYLWIMRFAHQVTRQQKAHLNLILQVAIESLTRYNIFHGSNWKADMPTLQSHHADGTPKYKYEFGKFIMQALEGQWDGV